MMNRSISSSKSKSRLSGCPTERGVAAEQYTIRHFTNHDDCFACVELQKEIWGDDFGEVVPPSILLVSAKIGGITAGAFDSQERLVGFVFGMSGIKDGAAVHWSDMLAVKPGHRDAGLGLRLKAFQRQTCLELGITRMYWSFDPLEARNAHLNINKLGAGISEYVEDMYADAQGHLHIGLNMDRCIMCWHLVESETERRPAESLAAQTGAPPVLDLDALDGQGRIHNFPTAASVRVAIPASIQEVKKIDLQTARRWRLFTKLCFQFYLGNNYAATGFHRGTNKERCYYHFEKREL